MANDLPIIKVIGLKASVMMTLVIGVYVTDVGKTQICPAIIKMEMIDMIKTPLVIR